MTLLTAVAAAVAVALLVVAFNLLLATSLDRDVDRTLRSKAAAAATTTSVTSGRIVVHDSPNDAAIDREVWVYEGRRAIVRPPGSGASQRAADALSRNANGFSETPDREARLHSVALTDRGRQVGSVVVSESLEPYDQTRNIALGGSVALGGLLLVLIAILTWAATGRALAPIREMTRTAADWSAHDQERRFGRGPRPDELGELASTFDALLDRLAASLRHEQRLSAELSHELRTPLARIAAAAELLRRRPRPRDELEEGLRAIALNADEMRVILDMLMTAARADAGLERGRSALGPLLDRVATRWRPVLEARGIALDIATPADVDVGVDAVVAERILTPLLQNAERHAVARVALSAERAGTSVLVHLDDDGTGIPEELRDAVFEPGETGTDGDGAGLGLPLARRLARATGAEVEAVSPPGGIGARLRVRLPG
ncbi:MAG TPA: HAMP domain-containing sensor histidine kinase [Solirubrobacteraceae bacterium]